MAGLTPRERVAVAAIALATVVAGILRYSGAPALVAFGVATIALAGLAWVVSFSTEQLGKRTGPGITGLLQSTLGNLPELFVVLFARSEERRVGKECRSRCLPDHERKKEIE